MSKRRKWSVWVDFLSGFCEKSFSFFLSYSNQIPSPKKLRFCFSGSALLREIVGRAEEEADFQAKLGKLISRRQKIIRATLHPSVRPSFSRDKVENWFSMRSSGFPISAVWVFGFGANAWKCSSRSLFFPDSFIREIKGIFFLQIGWMQQEPKEGNGGRKINRKETICFPYICIFVWDLSFFSFRLSSTKRREFRQLPTFHFSKLHEWTISKKKNLRHGEFQL